MNKKVLTLLGFGLFFSVASVSLQAMMLVSSEKFGQKDLSVKIDLSKLSSAHFERKEIETSVSEFLLDLACSNRSPYDDSNLYTKRAIVQILRKKSGEFVSNVFNGAKKHCMPLFKAIVEDEKLDDDTVFFCFIGLAGDGKILALRFLFGQEAFMAKLGKETDKAYKIMVHNASRGKHVETVKFLYACAQDFCQEKEEAVILFFEVVLAAFTSYKDDKYQDFVIFLFKQAGKIGIEFEAPVIKAICRSVKEWNNGCVCEALEVYEDVLRITKSMKNLSVRNTK